MAAGALGDETPRAALTKSLLRGHKDSVNCLAADEAERSLVCSGGADGVCRLWDLRANRRASVQAAVAGAEVTAVAFGPSGEQLLIAAAGLDVLGFDLRSERVLLREPAHRAACVAAEEINQVAVAGWSTSVLVAEDSGAVHLLDVRTWSHEETLEPARDEEEDEEDEDEDEEEEVEEEEEEEEAGEAAAERREDPEAEAGGGPEAEEEGAAAGPERRGEAAGRRVGHCSICSCLAVRPGHSSDFASGGLDCAVILWRRSARASAGAACEGRKVQLPPDLDEASATSAGGCQLLNPHFVHSLSYAPDGGSLAVGLGDGTVAQLDAGSGRLCRRLRGHASAVAQVLHAPAGLFSAGNDLGICLWGPAAPAPMLRLSHPEKVNGLAWAGSALLVAGLGRDVVAYEGFGR